MHLTQFQISENEAIAFTGTHNLNFKFKEYAHEEESRQWGANPSKEIREKAEA